jgi:acetyltransferase-like isoleucine patch superfamily enzyme
MEVGRHTYGHEQIAVRHWGEAAELRIGSFCSIADSVSVFLGGNHRTDWVTTYPFTYFIERWPTAAGIPGHPRTNGDVTIGNDVWVGSGATILSGVTIGDGAAIGADATVSEDVEPYAIVAGNPARLVRHRFGQETIARLLRLCWWDWSDERVAANMELLCGAGVERFLDANEALGAGGD